MCVCVCVCIFIYIYGLTRGLYTRLFHRKATVRESIILLLPPPSQSPPYRNTIARPLRNTRPTTDPPSVWRTLYNIGDGNIV